MIKEKTLERRLLIKIFYYGILRYTIIMVVIGSLIIFAVNSWRYNPLIYFVCFLICLTINFFNFFRKPEVKNEFKGDQ